MKICPPPEGKIMSKAVHCVAIQIYVQYTELLKSIFILLYTLNSHPKVTTADILD
jgi:hypothetical protein